MELSFRKVSDFERGILYKQLLDGYSFDDRYRKCFEQDWIDFDNFFFDNLDIADQYGFITVLACPLLIFMLFSFIRSKFECYRYTESSNNSAEY